MLDNICSLPAWEHWYVIVFVQLLFMVIEFALGKYAVTPNIKAGSTLELITNTVVAIVRRLLTRRNI